MINFLLLGIIGGHFLRYIGKGNELPPRINYTLDKLPPETSAMLEGLLAELNEQNSIILKDIRAKRHEIFDVLTSENFDINAYQYSTAKINELQCQLMKNVGEKIKFVAGKLSKEERIILAELLREPPAMSRRFDF